MKRAQRPDDLAVLAAMTLLTEEAWPMAQIETAMRAAAERLASDPRWLQTEIEKAIAADAKLSVAH